MNDADRPLPRSVPLTLENIRSMLATKTFGRHIHLYETLASTNSEAQTLVQAGATHGTVVVAESQSSGRGRHARAWFSPPGCNLYCSIIVRGLGLGLTLPEWLSWVPLTSALAVADAVQAVTAVSLSLKWPNDLLFQERKVGGILCESSLTSTTDPIIVIGIGLNVNVSRATFPDDLQPIAASLLEATDRPIDRNRLLAHLLCELEQSLDALSAEGSARLRQAYLSRCITLGRRVRVLFGNDRELIGTAENLSADGALQVRPLAIDPTASQPPIIEVRAGDVLHLRE
jgi:BirA family transcriptional regulator, biotin operon repressor / biotin---[acetyl-CoA-carboxylase] ligase